jgi:hypothetical protein
MTSGLVVAAISSLALQVGGVDLHATYLRGDLPGCSLAQQRANDWRREGKLAIFQRTGGWCVAGTMMGHQWVSEQWIDEHQAGRAWGWRVVIPMTSMRQMQTARKAEWPMEIIDRQLDTRLQIRHSRKPLAEHHQESVSLLSRAGAARLSDREFQYGQISAFSGGQFLVSGRDPRFGSYSIFLQR